MRPTTIERQHPIEKIRIEQPSRPVEPESDDIVALATSMIAEGVRFPVLLMPDGHLLKGGRRIAAAELLGWTVIPARTVHTMEEAAEAIAAQADESSLPRTLEERVDLAVMLEQLDRRHPHGTRKDRIPETCVVVGPAIGFSGSHYKRARALVMAARSTVRPAHIVAVARQGLEAFDAGTMTLSAADSALRAAKKTNPPDGLGADGLPITPPPPRSNRSPQARKLRMEWLRAMAGQGARAADIAERLGIGESAVKKIAKDMGLVVTADTVMGRIHRRTHDPARAVEAAVADLDALVWSLDRVDPAGLDPSQAAEWAAQLRQYARSIERASRRITKE